MNRMASSASGPTRRTVLISTATAALGLPLLRAPRCRRGRRPRRVGVRRRAGAETAEAGRRAAPLLREIDPRPDRGDHPPAGRLRHPAHPVRAGRPGPRDRRRPGLDLRTSCRAYAAASGGRMTVEKQSFAQTGRPLPAPTVITNVVATLRGTTSPERVYVVTGHYDSRNTDVIDPTSDAPGRRRRRVRGGGGAGAGPGVRPPADRGDDHPRRGGRRGAGLFRLGVPGPAAQGRRHRRAGDVQQRHRRHRRRARRQRPGPAHGAAVRRGRADLGDAAADRDPAGRRRRERRAVPPAGPVRRRTSRENSATGMRRAGRSGGGTGSCAAATTSRSCSRATRPAGSPSRGRTSPTSTRTSASRTARSSAT